MHWLRSLVAVIKMREVFHEVCLNFEAMRDSIVVSSFHSAPSIEHKELLVAALWCINNDSKQIVRRKQIDKDYQDKAINLHGFLFSPSTLSPKSCGINVESRS